jgi:Bacterial extracellular solute-binding proteins, family 5 Middle
LKPRKCRRISLTWTFRLRPGLKFHDGEPVLAKDPVASVNRWAAREPMGQMIKAIENELVAIDDRTFRWALKKPYPKMLLSLGKSGTPCCFVMPARIAATDPFRQIGEYVGSGPMRFVRNEWVPTKAVFEKFADYVPRQESASWLAGGKNIVVNRIEWITIPDPATAAAALQNGEVDWLELVSPDLLPILRKNRNVVTTTRRTRFANHAWPSADGCKWDGSARNGGDLCPNAIARRTKLIVLFRCFLANISFTTSEPSIDWRLLTEHIQRLGEAQSDVAVELLGRHLTGILRLFLGEFDVNSLKP